MKRTLQHLKLVSKFFLFAYFSNYYLKCFEFLLSLTFLSQPHTPNKKNQQSNHPFCCKNILVPPYEASSIISPFN